MATIRQGGQDCREIAARFGVSMACLRSLTDQAKHNRVATYAGSR